MLNTNAFYRDWEQLEFMRELPQLTDLVFLGNPVEEDEEVNYTSRVISVLLALTKLDGNPVIREVRRRIQFTS